jgi:hypothetical protein
VWDLPPDRTGDGSGLPCGRLSKGYLLFFLADFFFELFFLVFFLAISVLLELPTER